MIKLLTRNGIIIKEIEKAQTKNTQFNLKFVEEQFWVIYNKLITKYPQLNFAYIIFYMLRHTMDYYVVARIINHELKNVICYAGLFHTQNICYILEALHFESILERDTPLKCHLPDSLSIVTL